MKKKIRTIIALVLCMIISLSAVLVSAESYVRLYAEDGRSKLFPASQVSAQLTVGWYREPVQRLYAEGKSKVFPKSQVAAQLTVGWYTYPVQRLYTWGRSKVFPKSQVAAQLTVGWFDKPLVKMYALDGRVKSVPEAQVAANEAVGWFTEADYNLIKQGYWKVSENLLTKDTFNRKNVNLSKSSKWITNIGTSVNGYIQTSNVISCFVEYYLGGKYTDIAGIFATKRHYSILKSSARVKFIADEKLIYITPTLNTNSYPLSFKVNLKGCTKLRIEMEFDGKHYDSENYLIGNLKLYKWVK